MKLTKTYPTCSLTKGFAVACISALGYLSTGQDASATVTITNLMFTEDSVSFDISGDMSLVTPASEPFMLYFLNTDAGAVPGFVTGTTFVQAASYSENITNTAALVGVGGANYGDYFFIYFGSNLTAGQDMTGSFTASWSTPVFDPDAAEEIAVYWGSNASLTPQSAQIPGGTLLTTVTPGAAVPEPSSSLFIVTACAAGLVHRRRRA